jgi:hypothetical protein
VGKILGKMGSVGGVRVLGTGGWFVVVTLACVQAVELGCAAVLKATQPTRRMEENGVCRWSEGKLSEESRL